VAQRLLDPVTGCEDARMLVSSRDSPPALVPVRIKPFRSRATTSASQSVHGSAQRKRNRNENPGARRSGV
jgi:hypothetical protein